jgi:hypothetical protein
MRIIVQTHLQHYTEPSAEPLPTNSSLGNTVLPLSSGTFTHNASGVPIIVVCTKADLIDGTGDLASASVMVKGKSGEWEERTDSIMQILRTICLKCAVAILCKFPSETKAYPFQMAPHSSIALLFRKRSKSSDSIPYISFSYQQLPLRVLKVLRWHGTPFLSHTNRTHWIATI